MAGELAAMDGHQPEDRAHYRPRAVISGRYVGVTWLASPPSWKAPLPASVFCNENRRTAGLAHAERAESSADWSAGIPADWAAGCLSSPSRAISAPHII